MNPKLFREPWLERILALTTIGLGVIHAWIGRFSMNPDGMSYLDVGAAFFRRDWAHAVNAYWSPLYPWILGIVVGIIKPSPEQEFPLVHLVNFAIYVIAWLAFRFLLQSFLRHDQVARPNPSLANPMPKWALILLAYALFWWTALELETLYDVSPDLAVLACICFVSGLLLQLRADDALWKFVVFGFEVGFGYWIKAILFPLGMVMLAAGFWWRHKDNMWWRGMAIACLVFVITTGPLILILSRQKGRPTFGDSGRLAYAWCVSPRTFYRNWQGEGGSGTPAHPTREVLVHPLIFEFDGPVAGTYPPWTDPSYWNEGLHERFELQAQVQVLATNLASEARLLLRAQPTLVLTIIVFASLGGRWWCEALRGLWPVIFVPCVGMALYLPILENDRYLGGFLLVFFLALLAAPLLPAEDKRTVAYLSVTTFFLTAIGTADYTARIVTHHEAIPGVGPNSTIQDTLTARQLWRLGLRPDDRVAVIGNGTGAYWAHLGRLRIVAEIMDTGHGSREFWNSSPAVKQKVYEAFAAAHATRVVGICPADASADWQRLPGTPYFVRSVP